MQKMNVWTQKNVLCIKLCEYSETGFLYDFRYSLSLLIYCQLLLTRMSYLLMRVWRFAHVYEFNLRA